MTWSQLNSLLSTGKNTESFKKNNGNDNNSYIKDNSLDVPTSFKYISLGIILIILIFFFSAFLVKSRGNQ